MRSTRRSTGWTFGAAAANVGSNLRHVFVEFRLRVHCPPLSFSPTTLAAETTFCYGYKQTQYRHASRDFASRRRIEYREIPWYILAPHLNLRTISRRDATMPIRPFLCVICAISLTACNPRSEPQAQRGEV